MVVKDEYGDDGAIGEEEACDDKVEGSIRFISGDAAHPKLRSVRASSSKSKSSSALPQKAPTACCILHAVNDSGKWGSGGDVLNHF